MAVQEIKAERIGSGMRRQMADDTAISFAAPENGIILVVAELTQEDAIVAFDTGSGGAMTRGMVLGTSCTVTTGVLSGTTGTDVRLNISAHTDGNIYIENRLGAVRDVRWMIMGILEIT